MSKPIKLKINVSKVLKEHLYKGRNGTYLNIVAFPNKNGTGQYGDTHFLTQEVSKEAREAGERGPIIGNLTMPEDAPETARPTERRPERKSAPKQPEQEDDGLEEDDIPF